MGDARAALAGAAARFGFSATARLDAELLLAHALGLDRNALLLKLDNLDAPSGFAALVERRAAQEPVAYITGTRGFWTIDLAVGPGVLVPRADSETLIAAAVAAFGVAGPARVLDLGTGSGALLLAALDQWPATTGLGVDLSAAALAIARGNAARLGLAARADFARRGWAGTARFDLILCNPPYIEADADLPHEVRGYEPHSALFAGADGLDDYRAIAPVLAAQINPGGVAILEIGRTQGDAVTALLNAQGFAVELARDHGDRPRALVARLA